MTRNNTEQDMNGQETAQALMRFLNGASQREKDAFVQTALNDHRTLQQQLFGLMLQTMEAWAAEESYDLRNEYTVKTCQRIMDAIGNTKVPLI